MPGHCPVAKAAGLVHAGQIADLPAVVNTWPVVSTAIASYPGTPSSHATAGRPIATAAVANASASTMSGPLTEKVDHMSDGVPVKGLRISPRRSVLPDVATEKLWPVITLSRPPGPVPAGTPTRHGPSAAGSATTSTSPPR